MKGCSVAWGEVGVQGGARQSPRQQRVRGVAAVKAGRWQAGAVRRAVSVAVWCVRRRARSVAR